MRGACFKMRADASSNSAACMVQKGSEERCRTLRKRTRDDALLSKSIARGDVCMATTSIIRAKKKASQQYRESALLCRRMRSGADDVATCRYVEVEMSRKSGQGSAPLPNQIPPSRAG